MYIKKSTAITSLCFIAAGFLIAVGFIIKAENTINELKESAKYTYQENIANLSEGLANIDYALQKTLAAESQAQAVALSAEVWRETGMAEMCLENLPIYELHLDNVMKFFHQSGEYSLSLAKKSVNGGSLTAEEKENLRALSEQAKTLSKEMIRLEYRIQSVNDDFDTLNEFLSYIDEPKEEETETEISEYTYKNPLMKMESEMQMPLLNYDGKYSSHLNNISYEFLADKEIISEEEARRRAAYVLDCEPKDLTAKESINTKNLSLYVFEGKNVSITVTAAEGYPYTFNKSGMTADITITDDEAIAVAAKFLNKLKFKNMEFVSCSSNGNRLLTEFAFKQGEVLCLTDKILVEISLDDGSVSAFDASEYIKNHVSDRDVKPTLTFDEAKEKISDFLTVTEGKLTVIGTNSYDEPEKLCYEIKTKTDENNSVTVYINAKTGIEERIDLWYSDENGEYPLS